MALSAQILAELRQLVGRENVLTEPEDLIPYSFDGTAALQQMPGCVVFAEHHAAESQPSSSWPTQTKLAVVTRGSGTGLSGGSLPSQDCIVLCTVKMDKILELDRANLTMLVEPGVTTLQVADAATAAGLFYPPDPGSMKISTIGGNVAENSGGLRGLKYGVTRNYVMGLEVVLPDGEVMWLGNKCVKDVAGYSLKDIFIGSEGTLGVITKVLLRLIPKPAAKKTMVATFSQMDQAAEAVSAIIAAQIIPCTLEFLDRTTIHCVEDYAKIGLPLDCEALLLMETDGHPAVVAEEAAQMEKICRECGCLEVRVAKDEAEATKLASARRSRLLRAGPRLRPPPFSKTPPSRAANWRSMIRFVEADRQKIQTRASAPSATWATAICIPPSSPTNATKRRCIASKRRSRKSSTKPFASAAPSPANTASAWPRNLSCPNSSATPKCASCRELRKALDPERNFESRQNVRLTEPIPNDRLDIAKLMLQCRKLTRREGTRPLRPGD